MPSGSDPSGGHSRSTSWASCFFVPLVSFWVECIKLIPVCRSDTASAGWCWSPGLPGQTHLLPFAPPASFVLRLRWRAQPCRKEQVRCVAVGRTGQRPAPHWRADSCHRPGRSAAFSCPAHTLTLPLPSHGSLIPFPSLVLTADNSVCIVLGPPGEHSGSEGQSGGLPPPQSLGSDAGWGVPFLGDRLVNISIWIFFTSSVTVVLCFEIKILKAHMISQAHYFCSSPNNIISFISWLSCSVPVVSLSKFLSLIHEKSNTCLLCRVNAILHCFSYFDQFCCSLSLVRNSYFLFSVFCWVFF